MLIQVTNLSGLGLPTSSLSVPGNHGSRHDPPGIDGRPGAGRWPDGCRRCCHFCCHLDLRITSVRQASLRGSTPGLTLGSQFADGGDHWLLTGCPGAPRGHARRQLTGCLGDRLDPCPGLLWPSSAGLDGRRECPATDPQRLLVLARIWHVWLRESHPWPYSLLRRPKSQTGTLKLPRREESPCGTRDRCCQPPYQSPQCSVSRPARLVRALPRRLQGRQRLQLRPARLAQHRALRLCPWLVVLCLPARSLGSRSP